jgi:pimeloyl-ACP methyl ester carboxylesterase
VRQVLAAFPLPSNSPFVNQFFNLFFGGRMKRGPLLDFVTRQCWTTDQSVMAHRFRLAEPFDVRGDLHRVTARTLVLNGDRDLLVSKPSLRALETGLRHVRRAELPGCGHLAPEGMLSGVVGPIRPQGRRVTNQIDSRILWKVDP